jgi:hypothetical protein
VPENTKAPPSDLRDRVVRLARRMASPEGARALADAANATRAQSEALVRATRVEPAVLEKPVTM